MCWWVCLKLIAALLAPPTSYAGSSSPDGKNDVTINMKADIDGELCSVKVIASTYMIVCKGLQLSLGNKIIS